MFWQNRIVALVYRILVFGCTVAALVMLGICYRETGTWLMGRFDFLITLFTAIILIFEIIVNARDLHNGINGPVSAVWPAMVLAMVIYESTDVIVFSMSRAIAHLPYLIVNSEVMTVFAHLLVPILVLIDWIFFAEKATIKWSHAFPILFFPLAYCLAFFIVQMIMQSGAPTLMYISATTFYGESFPDWMRGSQGMAGVAFVTGICFLVFIVLTILYIFISGLVSGKFRRKYNLK